MTISILQPEAVDNLRPFFVGRNEPNYSWHTAIGSHLFMPGVTGFWPGSVLGNGVTPDSTGNGQTMTLNTVTLTNIGMAPCFSIPNTTSYLNTADSVLNSPISDMFFSAWVRFSVLGTETGIVNKWGGAGNRSFRFFKNSSNQLAYALSTDGTTILSGQAVTTLLVDTWYLIQFTISSTFSPPLPYLRGWINRTLVIATSTAAPACFNSTADLELGRATGGGTDGLRGHMSLATFGLYDLPEIYMTTDHQYTKALYGYN